MKPKIVFYLASSFELAERADAVCQYIESKGHLVIVKWWNLESFSHLAKSAPISESEFYSLGDVQATAERDFGGVERANALILITDGPQRKFNGAMVELGYALALGVRCYALGQLDRSAMFANVHHGKKLNEIIQEMEDLWRNTDESP